MPDEQVQPTAPFTLGKWRVRPSRNLLSAPAEEVQITHKCMEVLCALAGAGGEVVSRHHLLQTIWPDAVVNEESLTRVISDLRRVLGDDPSRPRYIETIPKRGYRLVSAAMPDPEPSPEPESPLAGVAAAGTRAPRRIVIRAGLVAVVVIALVWAGIALRPTAETESWPMATPVESLKVVALTSDPGQDAYPAFSADGTRIAFVRRESSTDLYHIYVKQPRQAREIQITDGTGDDMFPAWSPNGAEIAFVRGAQNQRHICRVPSLGGAVQIVHTVEGRVRGLDWSPDGRSVVFGHAPLDAVFSVWELDLATGATRRLVPPPDGGWGDLMPRYSPSGDRVVFIRHRPAGGPAVCTVPVEGGEVVVGEYGFSSIRDLDWYPCGRDFVVAAGAGDRPRIWRLHGDTGERTLIALPVDEMSGLSLCQATAALAIQVRQTDIDIMRYSLTGPIGPDRELPSEVLVRSTRAEYLPTVNQHDSRIAFCSERSGDPQIYVADADGGEVAAVTSFEGVGVNSLGWSPDGSRLLFGGQSHGLGLFAALVDPESGQWRALPLGDQEVGEPLWSIDGESIYFNTRAGDRWHAEKIRLDGSERQAIQAEYTITLVHQDSEDGSPYWIEPLRAGLRRLDADGNEVLVAEYPPTTRILSTGSLGNRIYYVVYRDKKYTLVRHDLAMARQDTLGILSHRSIGPLALYPDGSAVLVAAISVSSADLMLVPRLF